MSQQSTITQQQNPAPQHESHPVSHMTLAVIAIVVCFPLGMLAVHYAAHVNSLYLSGQSFRAHRYSRRAKLWAVAGIVTTPVIVAIVVAQQF